MPLRSQNYTVENVIKDVKQVDSPPPDPTNENFYNARHVISDKFSSTRRWVIVLKRFYKMPTKRHRKGLTYYEDSFTGKEAIDYLDPILPKCFDIKNCTRENCIKLLQQFLNESYFINVRDFKNRTFKDDASLYRFQKEVVERKLRNFGTIGRPSSIDGMLDLMSKNANIGHLREYKSPPIITTNLTRRKSFSSGNLPGLTENNQPKRSASPKLLPRKSTSQNQLRRSVQSNSKLEKVVENSKAEKDEEVPLPPVISNKSHHVILSDENTISSNEYEIPKIRRSSELQHPMQLRPRSISGTMLNARKDILMKRRPLGAVENHENVIMNTEIDEYKIWKFCLMEKLGKLLGTLNLDRNFAQAVEGMDIKWNCEMVNEHGFVKLRSNHDEISDHMRKMLRFLTKYPFDDHSVTPEVVYKGLELNTFNNICQQLAQMAPIIPQIHAELLVFILQHFQTQTALKSSITTGTTCSSKIGIGLTSGSLRATRPRTGSFDTLSTSGSSSLPRIRNNNYGSLRAIPSKIVPTRSFLQAVQPYNSPEPLAYIDEHTSGPYTSSPLTTSLSHQIPNDPGAFGRTFSTINSSTPSSMLMFSRNIPSGMNERVLISSRRSGSMDIVTPYGKSRIKLNPIIETIDPDFADSFILSMKLCLLTLKPAVRRRLHKLCHYLKKISENQCLILDNQKENRYVIIERVSQCFMEPSDKISVVESPLLFTFFLDYHEMLFTVPDELYKIVDNELHTRLEQKCQRTERRRSSQTPPAPMPFCERIDSKTYQEQQRETDNQLLKLLDTIIECKDINQEHYNDESLVRFPLKNGEKSPKNE
uniref:DEP domain-containing protein n=1 Tax=Acrobeloides nanus TaxID=290746 RepID=A0A914ECT0_9BILA